MLCLALAKHSIVYHEQKTFSCSVTVGLKGRLSVGAGRLEALFLEGGDIAWRGRKRCGSGPTLWQVIERERGGGGFGECEGRCECGN